MLKFRRLVEQDISIVAEMEKETFSDPWSEQSIRETSGQKQAFITVAEQGDKVVGYCIIYYVMDEAEIARIAVANECRRLGVGQGLLEYTIGLCKELQITRMLLDVRESNVTARNFYIKNGFSEDGVRKNFYENPKEHAVLMSCGL